MKIALDAMGGDFGPPHIVGGAVLALKEYPHIDKLYLVGDTPQIEAELKKHGCNDRPDRDFSRHPGGSDDATAPSRRSGGKKIRRSAAQSIS